MPPQVFYARSKASNNISSDRSDVATEASLEWREPSDIPPDEFPDLKCGLVHLCLGGITNIITHIQAHIASTQLSPLPTYTSPSVRAWAREYACLKQWAGLALLADRDDYKDRLFDTFLDNQATSEKRENKLEATLEEMKQAVPIPKIVVSKPGEATPTPALEPPVVAPAAPSPPRPDTSYENQSWMVDQLPQYLTAQIASPSWSNPSLSATARIHHDITLLYALTKSLRLTPRCPDAEPPRDAQGNVIYCLPVRVLSKDEEQYFEDWKEMLGWEAEAGQEALPELVVPDKEEGQLKKTSHPPKDYVKWSWFHGDGSVMPPVVRKWQKVVDGDTGKRRGKGKKKRSVWERAGWGAGAGAGGKSSKGERTAQDKDDDSKTVIAEDEDDDSKTMSSDDDSSTVRG